MFVDDPDNGDAVHPTPQSALVPVPIRPSGHPSQNPTYTSYLTNSLPSSAPSLLRLPSSLAQSLASLSSSSGPAAGVLQPYSRPPSLQSSPSSPRAQSPMNYDPVHVYATPSARTASHLYTHSISPHSYPPSPSPSPTSLPSFNKYLEAYTQSPRAAPPHFRYSVLHCSPARHCYRRGTQRSRMATAKP